MLWLWLMAETDHRLRCFRVRCDLIYFGCKMVHLLLNGRNHEMNIVDVRAKPAAIIPKILVTLFRIYIYLNGFCQATAIKSSAMRDISHAEY